MRALLLALLLLFPSLCSLSARNEEQALPPEYAAALGRAVQAFHERDFPTAKREIDAADAAAPDTPVIVNMKGAIAIEQKDFAEGERLCRKALATDPSFFPALFNLAEIPFVQKQYGESRRRFQELLEKDPRNELLQYRILLTHLLEKNDAAAHEVLAKMRFPSDSGAYYYAHAAWDFAHGNEKSALAWIKSGDWVFPRSKNQYFADVLYDLGWLKRPL